MTYAVTIQDNHRRLSRDRVRTRRTALEMFEAALINTHIRYRRLRYRHMAS